MQDIKLLQISNGIFPQYVIHSFYIIVLAVSTCNHISKAPITYEEALQQCEQSLAAKKKANPHAFYTPNSECMIGADLPIFQGKSINNLPINPSTLKGKITIINFWSIHCPPCIAEMPGLDKIREKYGTKKVNYIAIGWENKSKIRKFLEKHAWSFTQLDDGHDLIIDKFKMNWGFPTTFVLDKNAVIVAAFSGVEEVTNASEAIQEKLNPVLDDLLH